MSKYFNSFLDKKDWNVYHGHKMITDFSQPPPSTFKNVLPKPIP